MAVKVVDPPKHISFIPVICNTGLEYTVKLTGVVFIHPLTSVPLRVYTLEAVGLAFTTAEV